MPFRRENACRLGAFAAVLSLFWLATCQPGQAAEPTAGALGEAARWAAAKFGGIAESPPESPPGLDVLANNDPVQLNARAGKPMRIVNPNSHARPVLPCRQQGHRAPAGAGRRVHRRRRRGQQRADERRAGQRALRGPGRRRRKRSSPACCAKAWRGCRSGGPGRRHASSSCRSTTGATASAATRPTGPTPRSSCKTAASSGWRTCRSAKAPGRPPFSTEPPFSFTYGGKTLGRICAWKPARSSRELDADAREHTLSTPTTQTGLQVRCVAVEYRDFPTVEWTLYFKNTGRRTRRSCPTSRRWTPASSAPAGASSCCTIITGSPCRPTTSSRSKPRSSRATSKRITAAGGRPSNSDLPYFNLAWPGEGVIVVVGWPGQWAAQFARGRGQRPADSRPARSRRTSSCIPAKKSARR